MNIIYNYEYLQYTLEVSTTRLDLIKDIDLGDYNDTKKYLEGLIEKCTKRIALIEKQRKELKGTKLLLFKLIVMDNFDIEEAIDYVSEAVHSNPKSILENEYKEIENILKELAIPL